MKKNGFLEGAFIATISVVLCKILGLIYVIPFRSIIGEQGGALYSYAYSIYSIVLSLATVGIPTAVSKIVSEYNALNYQVIKEKAYKIGSKLIICIGVISFLALFIFAPWIAKLIRGNADGGNSIESVTLVIRVISTAILIVPSLSIKRGYLQGHNYMSVPQFSAVIEQFVRVIIVVVGSFIAYKVFDLNLDQTVAIAVFGATVGALVSYIFVDRKIKKNRNYFNPNLKHETKKGYIFNKYVINYILSRIVILVIGSFISYSLFKFSLINSFAIVCIGIAVGETIIYILSLKKTKFVQDLDESYMLEEEKTYTNKTIIRKIVYYALPLVLIDLAKSLYDVVDLFTVVRTLKSLGYSDVLAESVFGNIVTWASKLNMIVISISIGLTASLIPNIMPSFVKQDFKDVSSKVNKSLQLLIILVIPMTVGLSFLAYPVWNSFYGYDEIGINLFHVYVVLALTTCFQGVLVEISQIMNNTKLSFGSLFLGIIIKAILNIPLMYLLQRLGFESYYGPIISSIISQVVAILVVLIGLNLKYKISYKESFKTLYKCLISVLIMAISLFVLKLIIPIETISRIKSVLICILYALVGGLIYGLLVLKLKTIPNITRIKDIKNVYKEMRK